MLDIIIFFILTILHTYSRILSITFLGEDVRSELVAAEKRLKAPQWKHQQSNAAGRPNNKNTYNTITTDSNIKVTFNYTISAKQKIQNSEKNHHTKSDERIDSTTRVKWNVLCAHCRCQGKKARFRCDASGDQWSVCGRLNADVTYDK